VPLAAPSPVLTGRAAAPTVEWATVEQVAAFVRQPTTGAADNAELVACTAAANDFAWRRRQAAGYVDDDPTVAPGDAVVRGVVVYAGSLYREGGAADGFPSFAELVPGMVPMGTLGQVYRLLGVNRPVVA
jgi:hypothetical protein